MKKLGCILFIALTLTACKKEEKKSDGYVISGTAKGVYNGMRVFLQSTDERGNQIPQDTAIVMDETFKFEGFVYEPQMWYLAVNNVNGVVPIMVENEVIKIDFDKNNLDATKITGTKSNEALWEYSQGFKALSKKRMELNQKYNNNINTSDSTSLNKLNDENKALMQLINDYPFEFLKKNNDSFFTLTLIESLLQNNQLKFENIEEAYDNLDTDITNTNYGRSVKTKMDQVKKEYERLSFLDIGKEAPDFSAPNPEGKQLSLNEIKGKATIIDFWASWCGPCRRENPNVVKIYNKFHDKGLEIISVSLDRPGQKEQWLQAIKDDNLSWHHVSNLNYFNDPVAQQYNIQSIPATYILDADGKIVAKSLRGQALEDKIAEMLN